MLETLAECDDGDEDEPDVEDEVVDENARLFKLSGRLGDTDVLGPSEAAAVRDADDTLQADDDSLPPLDDCNVTIYRTFALMLEGADEYVYARATADFHGGPRYDFVRLDDGTGADLFARLVAIALVSPAEDADDAHIVLVVRAFNDRKKDGAYKPAPAIGRCFWRTGRPDAGPSAFNAGSLVAPATLQPLCAWTTGDVTVAAKKSGRSRGEVELAPTGGEFLIPRMGL